ncbi:MAG: acyl-CoA thioesterase [Rhodobacter sp.]|nr:acyl-CoA thioesterase [Paracoccaceae bacterium]MCC0079673.1 acyl-CoA thioesterase [Rhodobacter sp.]
MAFTHAIRVGWGDCDPAKIAYTGRLPAFALEAIDAFWEHTIGAGWYAMEMDRGYGGPFVHLDLDFRAPVTPRHPLICEVAPVRLGDTSVRFRVRGRQDGTLCFEGHFVSVFSKVGVLETIPMPAEVRAALEPLVESDA